MITSKGDDTGEGPAVLGGTRFFGVSGRCTA